MKTNMFATKERRKKVVIALAMVAVLLITGIMALFTDHKEATNVFTVGSIEIDLTEPNWVEANATEIAPNQVIAKDPMITNVGKNDAYTFIKVDIPKQDGNPLFELLDKNGNPGVNDGWVLVETGETADTITYVYGYAADDAMTRVTPGAPTNVTENLFSSVKVADVGEFKVDSCDIIVTGYGIQADDIPTAPAEVWPLIRDAYFLKYEMITSPASVGSGKSAMFESDASADIFKEVRIDGTAIASTNYTKSGTSTTEITLNDSYTSTLSKGVHTIELVSNDGFAKAEFEVEEPSTLITGTAFCSIIPGGATSVVFTDERAPDGVTTTDVSAAQDNSIVAWRDGTTYKVSTQKSGKKVYANPDSSSMFYGYSNTVCKNLTSINCSNLDTSLVTNMQNMFTYAGEKASTFTIEGLSSWDTSSVTNMKYMFQYTGKNASTWNIGDLSNWDTSKVTIMSAMFNTAGYSASTFEIKGLSGWDTSSVTMMSGMFQSAGYFAGTWNIGDLSGWDTSKVTDMEQMFMSAGRNASTVSLNLSGWDTSKVTNMVGMFSDAGEKASTFEIKGLSNWNTSKVTQMNGMFLNSGKNASTFDIGDLSGWDTSSVTNMYRMFEYDGYNASGWHIDCSSWNVGKVTNHDYFNFYVSKKVTGPAWVN